MCLGYGYDCSYRSTPQNRQSQKCASRSQTNATRDSSPSIPARTFSQQLVRQQKFNEYSELRLPHQLRNDVQQGQEQVSQESQGREYEEQRGENLPDYVTPIESNSGAAFVRLPTMTLESSDRNISPMRMLAWNLFLRERQTASSVRPETLTAVLLEQEVQNLFTIYFKKIPSMLWFCGRIYVISKHINHLGWAR